MGSVQNSHVPSGVRICGVLRQQGAPQSGPNHFMPPPELASSKSAVHPTPMGKLLPLLGAKMGEPDRDRQPAPFSRTDFEAIYWALLDFLTWPEQPNPDRRQQLRDLVSRLSEHVRHMRSSAGSGVHKRVNVRDVVRARLSKLRDLNEQGVWSIFGEEPDEQGDLILLTVQGGSYESVIERALDLPEFITKGMGGQIDRLGE